MTQAAKSRGQSEGFVDTLDPTQRASDLVAAQTGLNSDYTKSVGESMAFDPSGPISGKISQQYKTDSAGQADAASARLKKIIENLSVMRAPGQVAQTVGRRYGLAAGGVGGVNSNIASAGGAGSTDIEGVQPNPWLTGAGDALTGASQGIAARKTLKNSGGVF